MIPLKTDWRFPISFRELWRNLNRASRWLNGMQVEGGYVIHNENGIRIVIDEVVNNTSYSFEGKPMTDIAITLYKRKAIILPGGITLGPFTRIEWVDIKENSATILKDLENNILIVTLDDKEPLWYVWIDIDIRERTGEGDEAVGETAEWFHGKSIATHWEGLDEEKKKYTIIIPVMEIFSSDKSDPPDDSDWSIDEVKNLQCGDILIPRL